MSRTIEQLANEVRHVTASIPRQAEGRVTMRCDVVEVSPTESLDHSCERIGKLLDSLCEEISAIRGTIACVISQNIRGGVVASDYQRMCEITSAAIESSGYTLEDMRSVRRNGRLVAVRHRVMRVLYKDGYGSSVIGRFLNRDHGAVLHAVKKGDEV